MYVNIFKNGITTVSALKDDTAHRHLKVEKRTYIRLGTISGLEKDYPISVDYIQDPLTHRYIIVGASMYAQRYYRKLFGKTFDSLEVIRQTCLKIYTPTDVD